MRTAFAGPGTPERVWRAAGIPASLPAWDEPVPAEAVVVAPHPDDEVLGVGGLAACLAGAGVGLSVVAVTDGGASHPGSPTLGPADLRRRRAEESTAGLAALGLGHVPVRRLDLPDGSVSAHEAAVTAALAAALRPGAWCLAAWRGDGHPDHEAVGRAAAAACARSGARLVEYPVWAWHWAVPGDDRVPWERARRVDLPADVHEAKRRAAACHRTQVAPLSADPRDAAILPPAVLERLLRPVEVVLA